MALKLCTALLLLLNAFQEYQLQPIIVGGEKCSIEEGSSIVNEYSNLHDENIKTLTSRVEQVLTDAKNKTTQSKEYQQLLGIIAENKATLDNLKQGLCSEAAKFKFDLKVSRIEALQVKCEAKSSKNEISLTAKAQSALQKAQGTKAKATLSFQKCVNPKGVGDCTAVTTCCQLVLLQSTDKFDATVSKIESLIDGAAATQSGCLKKIVVGALDIETDIKKELLECKLQEVDESSESNESGEGPKTTGAPNPTTQTEGNQQTHSTAAEQSTTESNAPEESNTSTNAAVGTTEIDIVSEGPAKSSSPSDNHESTNEQQEEQSDNTTTPQSVIECTDEVSVQVENESQK